MDRQIMIEILVDDALLCATEGYGLSRIADILRNGFRGYSAFIHDELLDEIEIHGLWNADEGGSDDDTSAHEGADIEHIHYLSIDTDRFG